MNAAALDTVKAKQIADELAPRFADALWQIAHHGRSFCGSFGYLVESVLDDYGLIRGRHGPATELGREVARLTGATELVRSRP